VKRALQNRLIATIMLILLHSGVKCAAQQEPRYEMGTFYVCLLVKSSNWSAAQTPERMQIRQAHIKHIISLLESGKALLAGPFTDNERIAGVLVLNAASAEEAREMEAADPALKSGEFTLEVLKWWAAKGIMKTPAAPINMGSMTRYYFAFLRRGPKWTAQRTPETDRLQEAHMENIRNMAKAGKLVIAGPFENAGEYAGIFIFKVNELEEAKALSEADPAVKAGRLVVDVHPWLIPKGSLP